jgi:hypothetical protein
MKLKISRQIFEKSTNIIFIKIRPVGAKTCHTDRQAWMWQYLLTILRTRLKTLSKNSCKSLQDQRVLSYIIVKLGLRGLNDAFASQGCALSMFLLLILGTEFTALECLVVEYCSRQGPQKSLNCLRAWNWWVRELDYQTSLLLVRIKKTGNVRIT